MRRFIAPLLATAALLSATACSSSSPNASGVSPATAVAAAAPTAPRVDPAGAVVIDVRTATEFASGHLVGSLNIDVQSSNFATEVTSLDPTGRYLVYCRSGNRSKAAIDIMRSLGFTDPTELGSVAEASAATGVAVS
jgi:phage shock protein E